MANFPRREPDIVQLAQQMINGLTAHAAEFPAPPVDAPGLQGVLDAFVAAREARQQAEAAARQATEDKNLALDALADAMKDVLRYAENHTDFDNETLGLIGWAGRAEAVELQTPGQARALEVVREGPGGTVELDWKKPTSGGAPAFYRVQRQDPANPGWSDASIAIETDAILTAQPTGTQLEYRITANNKSGEGTPSNSVSVVL